MLTRSGYGAAGVAPRPVGVIPRKSEALRTRMRGGKKQAAPATDPVPAKLQRTMIEFCCGPDSLLGQLTKSSMNCEVVRLTKEEDVTTPHGFSLATQAINGPCALLWGSIPCTGGCPWQKINRKKPGGEANVRKHFAAFRKIWDAFVRLREKSSVRGGPSHLSGQETAHIGIGRGSRSSLMSLILSLPSLMGVPSD